MNERSKMLLGDVGILACALLWGSSYSVAKLVMMEMPTFWMLTGRFAIASAVIFALFHKKMLRLSKAGLRAGICAGLALAGNYVFAMTALKMTSAGNQAFICTTFVIMVPLIYWFVRRRFPGVRVLVAAFVSFAGLCLLTIKPDFRINPGDLLSLGSAFFLSIHMIVLDKYARLYDPVGLSVVQILTLFPVFLMLAVLLEPAPRSISPRAFQGLFYLAIFTSVLPYSLQTVAQKYTSAGHTAVILSSEGVFGVLFGVLLLGEVVTRGMFFACALILAGVLLVTADFGGKPDRK